MDPPVEDFLVEQMAGGYRTVTTRDEFSGKEVIVVRGAESIEDVFPDWIKQSRLDDHYYIPFDLNVPQTLPKRESLAEAYALDPPISEYGKLTAQVFARHLQSRGVTHKGLISIYTAPSLACLQTAHEIYHFLRSHCNAIRIDSGLAAECRGFDYWLKEPAIRRLGYVVDWNYKSLQRAERSETIFTIEERVCETVRGIEIEQERHCVLLVTDALSLSMINRRVRRLPIHFSEDIFTEKVRADSAVPPNSSLVFLPDCGFHHFLPRHLQPLTDSSGTLRVDLDDAVDFSLGKGA
ncbi:hypothetical protein PENTCL1PPCAC_453 [Pristionchus entomophagus]|uniref:Uncharacterized protein n=1 Tax=Pristionchus entomophagus TaxID=358040 RepID=A0AAV5S8P7_9BILA|nr:hypothetical protein PENTCL1PPCAC_453 [Pristionchus entomophagus]